LPWAGASWWLGEEAAALRIIDGTVVLSIAVAGQRVTPTFHRMQFALADGELLDDIAVPEVLDILRCEEVCPSIQGGVYHEDADGFVLASEDGTVWNDMRALTLWHVAMDTGEVTGTEMGPIVPGLPQQLVELPDGRLLFLYTQRHVNGTALDHTRAAYVVSTDGGVTWDATPHLIRQERGGSGQHFVRAVAEPDGAVLLTLVDNSAISARTRPFDTLVARVRP
jgi:hypothetical protein